MFSSYLRIYSHSFFSTYVREIHFQRSEEPKLWNKHNPSSLYIIQISHLWIWNRTMYPRDNWPHFRVTDEMCAVFDDEHLAKQHPTPTSHSPAVPGRHQPRNCFLYSQGKSLEHEPAPVHVR